MRQAKVLDLQGIYSMKQILIYQQIMGNIYMEKVFIQKDKSNKYAFEVIL